MIVIRAFSRHLITLAELQSHHVGLEVCRVLGDDRLLHLLLDVDDAAAARHPAQAHVGVLGLHVASAVLASHFQGIIYDN